ncbi:8-oxo-dGTP pyrophosphatase MutT (NUDIX family) [Actinoplanes couchii]|uniref:Phosphohydrolase n=1 Tax=Actinoplanes couchii TaxID=403638 RepID=A0ABQ3X2H7_9ACTN|nr:NUDIX domain-containing protein [Actinoplanes couchii]MDR6322446.1 8-oxo-dGTP pyrophosphatase MutT (NUDIX family) [Actinoplanes couchii]GID52679.1 phosphohydrolase [Actinoplanes couchii]
MPWEDSYLGRLRAITGAEPVLMTIGARAVLRDDAGRVLLIQRNDNARWAFPAGTMELGQTLTDCAIREVYEETGLTAHAVTPFALDSGEALHTNVFGATYQHVALTVRVDSWSGDLVRVTDETLDAAFFAVDEFPEDLSGSVRPILERLARFEAGDPFTLA